MKDSLLLLTSVLLISAFTDGLRVMKIANHETTTRCERMYPCFWNPCRIMECRTPPGLRCRPDYCRPDCRRQFVDQEGDVVPCLRTQRRRPRVNRRRNRRPVRIGRINH